MQNISYKTVHLTEYGDDLRAYVATLCHHKWTLARVIEILEHAIISSFAGFMKPFNIYVHTNNVETTTDADTGNTGFCFDFVQQPCTSSTGK